MPDFFNIFFRYLNQLHYVLFSSNNSNILIIPAISLAVSAFHFNVSPASNTIVPLAKFSTVLDAKDM